MHFQVLVRAVSKKPCAAWSEVGEPCDILLRCQGGFLMQVNRWHSVFLSAAASGGVLFEVVERHLSILAHFDEVAIGIAHVATPLHAVIVHRFSEKYRSFGAPFVVTSL